jgi:hypothetical protein
MLIFSSDVFHDSSTSTFVIKIKKISKDTASVRDLIGNAGGGGATIVDDRI